MNNLPSCVVMCPSQWFFHFGKEIIITQTPVSTQMFQYLSWPAAKEILDSVSPRTVMKDDGVRCQQVSLLSPVCWDEDDYAGNCSSKQDLLSLRRSVVQRLILLTLSRISFATGDGRYWNIAILTRQDSMQL
jgi:hypothetical protein